MKTSVVKHGISFGVLIAFVLTLTGCAWSVGGQKGATTVQKPTQGQELIDLQRAHERGAISEEEYERLRQRILK